MYNLTLGTFLVDEGIKNAWIVFTSERGVKLKLYLRKSQRVVNRQKLDLIDLASFNVASPKFVKKLTEENPMCRSGAFHEFHANLVPMIQHRRGIDGVYIENVLNPLLPSVLERYGYSVVPGSDPVCYYQLFSSPEQSGIDHYIRS